MRCSLLTLSSYLDHELPPERTGELEAHLIACPRCSAGLGYLREEADRIRGLAPVQAASDAADRLLIEVGIAAGPGIAPPPVPPQPHERYMAPPEPRAPIFEQLEEPLHEPDLAALHERIGDIDLEPSVELHARAQKPANGGGGHDIGATIAAEEAVADFEEPPFLDGLFEAEPGVGAAPETEVRPEAEPQPPLQTALGEASVPPPEEHLPKEMQEPLEVPGERVTPPEAAAPPSFIERVRDAIAVRWALMRGSGVAEDLDDSVQIVSGAGAPGWGARPAQQTLRERRERAAPPVDWTDAPQQQAATAPPQHVEPAAGPPAFGVDYDVMTDEVAGRIAPSLDHTAPAVPPLPPETGPATAEDPGADRVPPGRHTRGLRSGRPPRTGIARPIDDRRLWLYGGVVLLLLIIGVLAGKSVSTQPATNASTAGAPGPTAIPLNPTATPVIAQATPTPAATAHPTPVPAPAAPNPNDLTGVHTLGSGGSGFAMQDVRYGSHPNDFRMVFDLSGGSGGTPDVTVGFGNATTLYVEFVGVSGATPPAQPVAGNIVTSVQLLPQSRNNPGRTIYQITLSRAASLGTLYLNGPVRLVIDLS